ncbi:MAG TPA: extracellular solute-binding protein, partial [Candidatus Goldiibacteriota bacterium]|nr:extracellular solute-binding protein [Candidatus Goldiibacteriota bacterium]
MGKSKKSLSLIAVLLLLLAFVSCGNKAQSKGVTLRCAFWGDTSEIEIINNSVARFKAQNPGIDVKLERLPAGDAYTEKILTQIAGGTPPDVMF